MTDDESHDSSVQGHDPEEPPSREPDSGERVARPAFDWRRLRTMAILFLLGGATFAIYRAAVRILGASTSSVLVAGGRATIGDDAFPAEAPRHQVDVKSFSLDAAPVTAAAYRKCVERGACTAWARAKGCENEVGVRAVVCVDYRQADAYCRSVQKRLPTEIEWEYAMKQGRGLGADVGEWTSSDFCPYAALTCDPTRKVSRGGAAQRLTQRIPFGLAMWDPAVGFRCAHSD